MKARQMLSDGGFSPEDVVFLTNILEDLWSESKGKSVQNGLDTSAERERLALIIIGLAPQARRENPAEFKARIIRRFTSGE
jgi:hypothetical protein